MATDSHGGPFVPTGPTHNLGYEPDKFYVSTILAVPVIVIVTGAFAFLLTTLIFDFVFDPKENNPPAEMAAGAEHNAVSMNDGFARIDSNDPKAEVQQPRLEGMKRTEIITRDDGHKITAEMTTTKPLASGNPPMYHPEDLRAERWKELTSYGKNGDTARIPVDKAIELLTAGKLKLEHQKDAKTLPIPANWDRPKESNGGRGAPR